MSLLYLHCSLFDCICPSLRHDEPIIGTSNHPVNVVLAVRYLEECSSHNSFDENKFLGCRSEHLKNHKVTIKKFSTRDVTVQNGTVQSNGEFLPY